MPDGGTLTISTANATVKEDDEDRPDELAPGQYVVLTVSDTGIGMSDDVLAHAFEPFFTTQDVGQGSGLGLSMVHGFVMQSAGHVQVSSTPGAGTIVTIWLPRTTRPLDRAPTPIPSPPPKGTGETILVVEDDASLRRVAQTMLQSLGYTVLTASDGGTALTMLGREPAIELLFTDLALPRGMNGAMLAREAIVRRPDLKILFTSGFAEYAGRRYEMLDDRVALIAKPYRKVALARHVRQMLDEDPADHGAQLS
jgi:CheY-like chemotaxis protein